MTTMTSSKRRLGRGAWTTAAWFCALLTFFPVAWMFLSSFKKEVDAYSRPPTFIFQPTLEQYANLLTGDVLKYLTNSVIASGASLLVVLILGVPAAYALAIVKIRRWRAALFFFLMTRYLPAAAVIVPLYLIARDLSALNNVWTLTVLYIGMNMALGVWMLHGFIAEIPMEVFEAAWLDGAGLGRTLLHVVVPIMRPGIAATAIICFIFSWNEFFFAVNLTSSADAATLPVFLVRFVASEGPFWAQVSAAATVAVLPVLLLGWIAQRSLLRGLTMGAVK